MTTQKSATTPKPQTGKGKKDAEGNVIDIDTRKPTDSDKPAKPVKKSAKPAPKAGKAAPKAGKAAPKAGKAKKEPLNKKSSDKDIKDAINSTGDEKETFVPTPIQLDYSCAGQDPNKMKEMMVAVAHYQSELGVVKQRFNSDVADCREVWEANKKPIQESIQKVYDMAAEKGVTAEHFDFLIQMNKPMSKAQYERLQQQRQLTLDVFGV